MNTMMNSPSIDIRHAFLAYNNTILFDDLNLTLAGGKWTCLLGPSGVGKTTLLRMIANLVSKNTKFSGAITTDSNQPLFQQISYMAQTDLLMPWFTALDNALISARLNNAISPELLAYAKELFLKVGLKNVIYKYPKELSLGMRQRVALVRILLQDKPIVLMDEPFSALDAITRFQLQSLAAELLKDKTVLFVTHDPMEALRLADEIVILSGMPATLNLKMKLLTPKPRDPSDPELISHQAELFHALIAAKELET